MSKRTLGIEREWFITKNGKIAPEIGSLLPQLKKECRNRSLSVDRFCFELFAGQVEDRTPPAKTKACLIEALRENEYLLKETAAKIGLDLLCADFIEENILGTLIVNPFDARHQEIWNNLSHERKVAASQVAAIHLHIKVTIDEAVKILNYCRKEVLDELCQIGDFSNGARLKAYRDMAGTYGESIIFSDANHLLSFINSKGGEKNVWDMIRYKISTGTIEFRMFGSTSDYNKIENFILCCEEVVGQAIRQLKLVNQK